MVHWIFACFVSLIALYQVKAATFSFCTNFILASPFYDSVNHRFKSQISGDTKYANSDNFMDYSVLDGKANCSSTYMNKYAWNIRLPHSGCVSGTSDFGLGLWVNFESTIGTNIAQFGNDGGYTYTHKLSSENEGIFSWNYVDSTASSVDTNEFTITIPLNQWTFMAFHWSGSTVDIYLPGQAWLQKSATGSYPFTVPTRGYTTIGKNMQGHIYQFLGFKSVKGFIDGSIIIPLFDGTNTYEATATCEFCADTVCHPSMHCLSFTGYCSKCITEGCTECSIATVLPDYFCNPNCPTNCAKCSSPTVCSQCNLGYYLYDNAGETSCISCTTSCSACNPGPTCYECADSIVQDGSTCRVDKIGYQLSFSTPNIEINFAHPLASDLTVSNLVASTGAGSPINTDQWKLITCVKGVSSCSIVTDLSLDDLPIDIDFMFSQV